MKADYFFEIYSNHLKDIASGGFPRNGHDAGEIERLFPGQDVIDVFFENGKMDAGIPEGFSGICYLNLPVVPCGGFAYPSLILDGGDDVSYFVEQGDLSKECDMWEICLVSGNLIYSNEHKTEFIRDADDGRDEIRLYACGDTQIMADAGRVDLYDSAFARGTPDILHLRHSSGADLMSCGELYDDTEFDGAMPSVTVHGFLGYARMTGGELGAERIDELYVPQRCVTGRGFRCDAGSIGFLMMLADTAECTVDRIDCGIIRNGKLTVDTVETLRLYGTASAGIGTEAANVFLLDEATVFMAGDARIERIHDDRAGAPDYPTDAQWKELSGNQSGKRSLPANAEELVKATDGAGVPDLKIYEKRVGKEV